MHWPAVNIGKHSNIVFNYIVSSEVPVHHDSHALDPWMDGPMDGSMDGCDNHPNGIACSHVHGKLICLINHRMIGSIQGSITILIVHTDTMQYALQQTNKQTLQSNQLYLACPLGGNGHNRMRIFRGSTVALMDAHWTMAVHIGGGKAWCLCPRTDQVNK